jgi:uncharacterized protein YndB with AHSA1/START domain
MELSGETGTFAIRRTVAAPVERVWEAYMNPEQFVQFWAPSMVEIPLDSVVIEPRVGGRFECTMIVEGVANHNAGTFVEFVENSHFRFGEPRFSEGFSSIMSFTSVDGGTQIDVEQSGLPVEFLEGANEGFTSVFDQLEALLAND